MPATKVLSGLQKKYGAKLDAACKANEGKTSLPADYSNLPPGINNGIAQVDEAYFEQVAPGKQNAGEYYFRASAVVMSPEYHNGVPVKGLHTSHMEMICDTTSQKGATTTMQEHILHIHEMMRSLAGTDFTAGREGADQLEALAADLAALKPYVRFSTTPKKDQKTGEVTGAWERWHGGKGLENWSPDAVSANGQPFTDGTGQAPSGEGEGEQPADEGQGTDPDADGVLTELATKADGNDEEAASALADIAKEAGVPEGTKDDPDSIAGAASWAAVVQMIRAAAGFEPIAVEEPEPESEPEKPAVPAKGEVWKYKPLDPKTKKPSKAVEVTIVEVQAKPKTVTCRNNTTKAVYKSIAFDKLEPAE